ncbi:P-loop containing nucleoside triphosphate hydrolase protein [Trametes meyenii]|nr:P-loop containing nucleoside triphosphate hydrolase protein [Trametes meyenii]
MGGSEIYPKDTLLNTEYGKSSKELIEFVGQLRALGAHIDLELPRIVVIGNQSAGKSSLVEAISGISVPRDAGTCTRCPMECRLSHSPSNWSCQIKIRYEYDQDGKPLADVEERDFGTRITDKSRVEGMLRRAQAAVLRPDIDPSEFVHRDRPEGIKGKKPLRFSKNVVCVELTGPDLADLSFVDLPGIVQNAEPEVVQLVEDMVNHHIKGTSLILVTLPMSDDIENQKAARLAQLADPKGHRTIGVLTKPDTLTAGATKARDMWLDVLEGRRYPLLHGYYCTRQPDDDERLRGIAGAAAREAEAAFFSSTAPWAGVQRRERFGTTNLVQSISKLLTQIIRESLPELLGKVAAQLETCTTQLEKLPPAPTTEPSAFVLALVTRFAADLAARIHGAHQEGSTELVQRTRRVYETYKYAVLATAPPFVPYVDAAHAPRDLSAFTRAPAGDRAVRGRGGGGKMGVMYLGDVKKHIRASVTRELPGNVPYAAKVALIRAFQDDWVDTALACFEEVLGMFKDAVAEAVREVFERYANLKAIVGPVTMELINGCAETTTSRIRAALELEASPFTQNGHYLSDCRDKWLAKYKDARAGKATGEHIIPALPPPASAPPIFTFGAGAPTTPAPETKRASEPSSHWARPMKKLRGGQAAANAHLRNEPPLPAPPLEPPSQPAESPRPDGSQMSPTSTNSTASSASGESTFDVASTTSGACGAATLSPEEQEERNARVQAALASLAAIGYAGLTEEDLGKLNKADEYEEELQLMAEVRAYFQVAYKRVIDTVPLTIDHNFLYAFAGKLHERLFERLGLGTANAAARCVSYVEEDRAIVAQRDELTSKKRRLENVQRALYNFGM